MKKQKNINKKDLFILLIAKPEELLNKFICYKLPSRRIIYLDYIYYIEPCREGHYLCNSFFSDKETSYSKESYKEKVGFDSLNKLLSQNVYIISYF